METKEEWSFGFWVCVTVEVDKPSQSSNSFVLAQSSNEEIQFETEGSKIEDQILAKSLEEGEPE